MPKARECQYCHATLSRDETGLNKKLFVTEAKRGKFSCIGCMAEILEVTVEELEEKIREFKEQGCRLFS